MSNWNIGADHDSDEVLALKSTLSAKENEIAMLKDQLIQSSTKWQEVEVTLKDTNYKLRLEADKRTKLEEDLRSCSEDRQNQTTLRENVELTLNSLNEKFKASEKVSRDLQATIDQLICRSDGEKLGSLQAQTTLERENTKLLNRVRELEFEYRQFKDSTSLSHATSSPAIPDSRIIWLEQENDRLRQSSASHDEKVKAVSDRLVNLQASLARVENEKVANERRLLTQLKELQTKLADSEEELDYLRHQVGDDSAAEREQRLMERIDEDQAKIEQLEKLVDGSRRVEEALLRTEAKLKLEIAKASAVESRNVELVREKEDALEEARLRLSDQDRRMTQLHAREKELVEQLNARISMDTNNYSHLLTSISHADTTYRAASSHPANMPSRPNFEDGLRREDEDLTYPIQSTPVLRNLASKFSQPELGESLDSNTVQRLLMAIERIRGERDDLKRHLEFSQMEHKFAVQAYETKMTALLSSDTTQRVEATVTPLEVQDAVPCEQTNPRAFFHQSQVKRLNLALMATSIVIGRLQSNLDHMPDYLEYVIQAKEEELSDSKKSDVLEMQLTRIAASLSEVEQHRTELLSRIQVLEGTVCQSENESLADKEAVRQYREELAQLQSRFDNLTNTLSDVETERDSLNLRVQHLESDLSSVQEELTDAQIRYSSLQAQKLSSMTSNAATRTLKQQIEELEARVMRRTEQIGIHQHDIRRMETNLRLQEERIAEMTLELETLSSQKEAMVEDCAEAREARDIALQQVEAMEIRMEAAEDRVMTLEGEKEREVVGLVCAMADTASRTRETVFRMKSLLHVQLENQRRLMEKLCRAEEMKQLATNRDIQQVILALAVSQKACGNYARSLECMKTSNVSMEAKIREQQEALVDVTAKISLLHKELAMKPAQASTDQLIDPRMTGLEEQIQILQQAVSEAENLHSSRIAELLCSNEELQAQDAMRVQNETDLREEIRRLNALHVEEIQSLQDRLRKATEELDQVRQNNRAKEDDYQRLQRELACSREDLHSRSDQLEHQLQSQASIEREAAETQKTYLDRIDHLHQELDVTLQKLEETSRTHAELKRRHDTAVEDLLHAKEETLEHLAQVQTDCDLLQEKLDHEINGRNQERQKYQDEIRCTIERSHNTEAELHREVMALRTELEHCRIALQTMTEEKNGLEAEMTNLEAEIQRSISLRNYLEKQVKDDESQITSLKDKLSQIRKEYAHVEKNWSSTEVQLSLQQAQHAEVLSGLKLELEGMRNKPNLESELTALQESYDEIKELLQAKCVEVEATDDKYLEVLQERRKLNIKVDNLQRKVQTLEKKLAEAVSCSSRPAETRPNNSSLTSMSSHPKPAVQASSSQSRRPSLVRSKTPERKMTTNKTARPPLPPQSHETIVRLTYTDMVESSSSGKKRKAPEDFDTCETVPAQVFTPDSAPSRQPENVTPRPRKFATPLRTGFTPVRNKPASTDKTRRVTATPVSATPPTAITDVTNSTIKRSFSHSADASGQPTTTAAKRSWLRNVKSAR